MPAPGQSNRKNRKSWSPWAWLFIAVLVGANIAMAVLFWAVITQPGYASGPALLQMGTPAANFLLPQPAQTSEPTPTATQVVIYLPTATVTPTPSPPASPTPAPTGLAARPPPTVTAPPPTQPPTRADIEHVVIISIDGLRPDALDQTYTPTLDQLRALGAYSPDAQTVSLSVTLPSHASMLSGMLPEKHGITWGLPYIGWPGMNGPTLFNIAHDAGLSTAMAFGKEKLNYLVLPNSVDTLFGQDTGDEDVKINALKIIDKGLPNVLFIHFPDVDRVGHQYGWLSVNQLQSVTYVDGLIGDILAALEGGAYRNRTLLIVTADHGGHGRGHGDDSPEDRTIPWLAAGPGVRPGIILSSAINTYDTAATAAYALDLTPPGHWDGQPVLEIFE